MVLETGNELVPPASSSSAVSPIPWHTLTFILFVLAANSVAQPSGRVCGHPIITDPLHRSYFCSSPLVCLADSIDIIARFIGARLYLRLPSRQACQIAVLSRSEKAIVNEQASILHLRPEQPVRREAVRQDSNRVRRWMIFLVAPLPATIRLAWFEGTPWTKAWGLIFVASFLVIELFGFLGRTEDGEEASSVPEVLGLSQSEWERPENDPLRSKIEVLTNISVFSTLILFVLAMFAHSMLQFWQEQRMVSELMDMMGVSDKILYALTYIGGYIPLAPQRLASWIILSSPAAVLFLAPVKLILLFVGRGKKIFELITTYVVMLGFFWLSSKSVALICKRWPSLVSRLALDGGKNRVDDSPEVVARAWAAFYFCFKNIILCLLWYGFMYDPTGTTSHSWTGMLG